MLGSEESFLIYLATCIFHQIDYCTTLQPQNIKAKKRILNQYCNVQPDLKGGITFERGGKFPPSPYETLIGHSTD